ncbi:hypothetical protein OIV83_000705 [Microbotryomycetes sp. JL201]|nr:hypothetical protein OIV83_000705 [Microbotryomycetes sp. JL201]
MAVDDALLASVDASASLMTAARDASRRDVHPTPPATAHVKSQAASDVLLSANKVECASQTASPAALAAGHCRLLWRGRLVDHRSATALHGVAIIAQLFTISSPFAAAASASVAQHASRPSPFDDPFTLNTAASGADMCLGIEMQRGADLRVLGEVTCRSSAIAASRQHQPQQQERPTVEVETPTDVRVFVDPRCHDTVSWFEDMFCREGREGLGVRLDIAGEDVVIMAQLPPRDAETGPDLRPELSLVLGRVKKPVVRAPRPDDPMPRENLFASKLRQSMSLPTFEYSKRMKSDIDREQIESAMTDQRSRPLVHGMKSKRQAQAFLTLMGNKPTRDSRNRAQSIDLAEPPTKRARGLQRSSSVYDFSKPNSSNVGDMQVGHGRAQLKRSRSVVMSQMSPPPSPPHGRQGSHRSISRAPDSPTPSISMASGEVATEHESIKEEEDDMLSELTAPSRRVTEQSMAGRKSLSRSASLPIGAFGEALHVAAESGSTEARNKQASCAACQFLSALVAHSVRKLVFARMAARGVGRDDEQFKDVFGMTSKGVQFALRETFKTSVIDKLAATDIVESHLDMYIRVIATHKSPRALEHELSGDKTEVAPHCSPKSAR